jgi:hypothetical protein
MRSTPRPHLITARSLGTNALQADLGHHQVVASCSVQQQVALWLDAQYDAGRHSID